MGGITEQEKQVARDDVVENYLFRFNTYLRDFKWHDAHALLKSMELAGVSKIVTSEMHCDLNLALSIYDKNKCWESQDCYEVN